MKISVLLVLLALASSLGAQQVSVTQDSQATGQTRVDLGSFTSGVPTSVAFTLHNNSATALTYVVQSSGLLDLQLSRAVTITGMVNCTVAVSNQPDLVVAPGESAQLFLDVTPHSDAPMSFSLNVTDGVNTVSQEYTGAGTVLLLGPHRHGVSVSGHCSTGESSALLLLFVPVLLGLAVLTRNSRRPAKA